MATSRFFDTSPAEGVEECGGYDFPRSAYRD